ncbi:MAG: Peptidase BlaR1 [Verrucomicrobiales bacterium]|nr:Peptidase BlaR1 [Verrucomicrobiales bacterium]
MLTGKCHSLVAVTRLTALAVLLVGGAIGCKEKTAAKNTAPLREQQLVRIQSFFVTKEKQANALAAKDGKKLDSEIQDCFNAGIKGDWKSMSKKYKALNEQRSSGHPRESLRTASSQCLLEAGGSYELIASGEPKYIQTWERDIFDSIPTGSIYFGATDAGRFLITAFSKSHVKGDPFFTLTQNALADGTYLEYLRSMYGGTISTPTGEDSQRCFNDYLADAQKRLASNQLRPGEDVKVEGGRVQVSGQVAVMAINGLLVKTIFDKNPDREFYIEESFPLDWMYSYLEPHGLILKINREPLPEISDKVIDQDREYWSSRMNSMIGDWLTNETPIKVVTDFVEKVYLRKDLNGFKGDPLFVQSDDTQKMFSKLRSSVGGLYVWRMEHATSKEEKARMARAADLAFRQALALCPYSPEVVYRYVQLANSENRISDAILVASTCAKLDPDNKQIKDLIQQLKLQMPKGE